MSHATIRRWSVVLAVIFAIAVFPPVFALEWCAFNKLLGVPKIEAYPWDEPSKEAFTMHVQLSSTLFQTSVLLIAAMWGLVLGGN